jgi:pimeloyl-ACP methyl ester carboxylesterase
MGKKFFPSTARPALPWQAGRADDDYGATAQPDWREIDWRAHTHQVEVDGCRLNYVDIGDDRDDEPVVFIHGLGASWQSWLENIPRAATERRVLAVDLPGHGRSGMPREEISISGVGRTIDAFCDELDLGAVCVVGNSTGGFVGAEMAIRFPDRVERLVLVAAAGLAVNNLRRRPTMTVMRAVALIGAFAGSRSRTIASRPRARHLLLGTIMRHPSRLAPDLAYELISTSTGTDAEGFLPTMEALMSYDFRDRLPEIGCPTLIIQGREDMLVPVRDADEFESLIPDARKVILEDTGHTPMIERPQTFNDLLMEFLAERGEARDNLPADSEAAA